MGKTENKGGSDAYQEYESVLTDWELWKRMRLRMPHLPFLEEAWKDLPGGAEFLRALKETLQEGETWTAVEKRLDALLVVGEETAAGAGQQPKGEAGEASGVVESRLPADSDALMTIRVEELRIRNYRRYKGGTSEARLRPAMEGGVPDSLFMIGSNGGGKSTQYDALEYLLTGTVQEGGMRSQDFIPRQERDEKVEVTLLCNGLHEVFSAPEQLQQRYPGIIHYGIFCSESDILKLGSLKALKDYTCFFAWLMGYEDLLSCRRGLRMYIEEAKRKRNLEDLQLDAYAVMLQQVKKNYQEAQRNRMERENGLLGKNARAGSDFSLRAVLVAIRQGVRGMAVWCKKAEQDRKLEEAVKAMEEIGNNMELYNQVETEDAGTGGVKENYQSLKDAWDAWKGTGKAVPEAGDLTLGYEEDKQRGWEKLVQAVKGMEASLKHLPEKLEEYVSALKEEEKRWNVYEELDRNEEVWNRLVQLKDMQEVLDQRIRNQVQKHYREYADWVEQMMHWYSRYLGEEYDLKIAYDGDGPDGKLEMVLRNKDGQEVSPAQYYNNFRYKLFCLLLRLVGGLAYMKLNKVRVPIVLDDVFYGSDFNSRAEVKVFWDRLMKSIRQQLGETVQLLVFTHDEIILNAALNAVVDLDFEPVQFGRILDSDYIKRPEEEQDIKDETDVFYKVNYPELPKKCVFMQFLRNKVINKIMKNRKK